MTPPINKSQILRTNNQSNSNFSNSKQKYNLEERTTQFSEEVIDFIKILPSNFVSKPLIDQLLRSATSIGANYCEANEANSRKDFINKIAIAKKESKETKYWLRIIAHTFPNFNTEIVKLFKEAEELNLILAAIIRKSQKHSNL